MTSLKANSIINTHLWIFFCRFLGIFLLIAGSLGSAIASQDQTNPLQITQEKSLEQVIHLLENEGQRQDLIQTLQALRTSLQQPNQDSDRITSSTILAEFFDKIKARFQKRLTKLSYSLESIKNHFTQAFLLKFLSYGGIFIAALMAAQGIEGIFRRFFKPLNTKIKAGRSQETISIGQAFALKGFLRLLDLAVFFIIANSFLVFFNLSENGHGLLVLLILIVSVGKALLAVFQLLLSPQDILFRVFRTVNSELSLICFAFTKKAVALIVTIMVMAQTIITEPDLKPLVFFFEASLMLSLTIMGFRFMTSIQAHHKSHGIQKKTWPLFVKIYLVTQTFFALVMGNSNLLMFMMKSLGSFSALLAISLGIDRAPMALNALLSHLGKTLKGLKKRKKTYLFFATVLLWVFSSILLIAVLNWIWDHALLESIWDFFQEKLARLLSNLLILLMVGISLWEASEFLLDHFIQIKKKENLKNQSKTDQLRRLETLLPLFNNSLRIIIIIFVGLMMISEMGFNITPLLAGASVLGIALSLGAQSLVKDFINGCFILFENTISLEDQIEVGDHKGIVETLSLRSLTLRDALGAVHTIPFSTITTIVNLSKNFSKCQLLLDFNLSTPYQTVCSLLTDVGQILKSNPDLKDILYNDLEILGIDNIESSRYTVKVHIEVAPGQQWRVQRAFFEILADKMFITGLQLYSSKYSVRLEQPLEASL